MNKITKSVNKLASAVAAGNKNKNSRGKRNRTRRGRKRTASKQRGAAYRLVGKDLVQSLPANIVASKGYFGIITANPAYWSGTRIAAIASAYQSYSINKFTVEYVPQVSVGYNGTVIMGTKWDNGVTTNMQQQSLYTSPGGRMVVVYKGARSNVPLSGLQLKRFNMAGDLSATTNPFVFLAAVRAGYLSYQGSGDTPVTPGYFVVHYDYTLYNPIGAGWRYSTSYMTTQEKIDELASTTVMLAEDASPYGAGTYFDYTGGQLSWQQTPISIPAETLINVYANGPAANEQSPDNVAITGQSIRIVNSIQFRNAASREWQNCRVFKVGAATYQGVPGYSSAYFGIKQLGVGALDTEFQLTVWHDVKQISLANPVGWYAQMPDPSRTGEFRVGTVINRHSSICPVNGWNVMDVLTHQLLDTPNTLIYPCTNVAFENEEEEADMDDQPIPDDAPQDWVPVASNTQTLMDHVGLSRYTVNTADAFEATPISTWDPVSAHDAGDVLEPLQDYILIAKYWPTPDVPYRVVKNGEARIKLTDKQKNSWYLINNPVIYNNAGVSHPLFGLPSASGRVTLFGRNDNGDLIFKYNSGQTSTYKIKMTTLTYRNDEGGTAGVNYIMNKNDAAQDRMGLTVNISYVAPTWSVQGDYTGFIDDLVVCLSPQLRDG